MSKVLVEAMGVLQALRNHIAHWQRVGIDDTAIAQADEVLAAYLSQQGETQGQCGEVCERAKLCATCARGLEEQTHETADALIESVLGGRMPADSPNSRVAVTLAQLRAIAGAAPSTTREFTNELGNAIRITIEGPTSTSENVLTPLEVKELLTGLMAHHSLPAPVPEGWTPTAENINALPEPVRAYIHALEANSDPSGVVRDNMIKSDMIRALEASNRRIRDELDTSEYPHERMDELVADRYRVVESGNGWWRYAIVAGTGTQNLYKGNKSDCEVVARIVKGAFLDGGFALSEMWPRRPAAAKTVSVGDIGWTRVRVDTQPDENGWCFCTPMNHPDDVASGETEEFEDRYQFFGGVVVAPPKGDAE